MTLIHRMRGGSHSMAVPRAIGQDDCTSATPRPGPDSVMTPSSASSKERLSRAFEQNAVFIWRSLRRLGVSREAADDATQQVFLVAARRMHEIPEGKERAFLFQSAMRVGLQARRELAVAGGRIEHD